LIDELQGHDTEALKALQEAVSIARATGDKGGLAGADLTLGLVLRQTGDLAGAEATYVEAGSICRELSDPLGTASTLNSSASVNISRGEYGQAASQLAEAEQTFRKLGNRKALASALSNIGTVALYKGELAKSEAAYKEECELHQALQENELLASCHINQALEIQEAGRGEESKAALAQVLNSPERASLTSLDWAKIVIIEIAAGALADARNSLEQARTAAAKSHDPEQTIPVLIASARLDEASGNRPRAAAALARARSDAERFGLVPLAQIAHPGVSGLIRPGLRYANVTQR
jgi:tetratricopeptide (TPR) repeat protein